MCRTNASGDSPFQGLAARGGCARSGLLEWTDRGQQTRPRGKDIMATSINECAPLRGLVFFKR